MGHSERAQHEKRGLVLTAGLTTTWAKENILVLKHYSEFVKHCTAILQMSSN